MVGCKISTENNLKRKTGLQRKNEKKEKKRKKSWRRREGKAEEHFSMYGSVMILDQLEITRQQPSGAYVMKALFFGLCFIVIENTVLTYGKPELLITCENPIC